MEIETAIQCLNDKINLLSDTIAIVLAALSLSIAIGGAALYFIVKQITHSKVEEELPKHIKNNPPINKIKGKLNLIPSYDYNINRFRQGKINISNINSFDDILFINIFYYQKEDSNSIEESNPSLSSTHLSILSTLSYKVPIIKYGLELEGNILYVYTNQENIPKDIFYEIIYKNY